MCTRVVLYRHSSGSTGEEFSSEEESSQEDGRDGEGARIEAGGVELPRVCCWKRQCVNTCVFEGEKGFTIK